MGFFFGFICGLLFIPLCILAGVYLFFTYSESYAEKRKQLHEQSVRQEKEQEASDLNDMPSALYASYLGQRYNNGTGLNYVPEHLDPQYQFAGWVSVKRIPEVDHRIIEPSLKKENKKKAAHPNGNNRKGSNNGSTFDSDGGHGAGVAGSLGAGAASVDSRFTFLDTQNPHLSLPPSLQARFKDSKYAVLKGPTMFIYENEHLEECLGVITLPHYEISVPGHQKDSHVFSKRNPIWLKYQPSSSHSRHSTASSESGVLSSSKDYYLSMVSCVDKEDLYFTLLRCCKLKPNVHSFIREIPKRDSTLFDKAAMNKLIRNIHSNEHQFQAAWLNAIIGRMFLGIYKTPQIKDAIFQKLVDKLSRVRLPNFLNDIRMKSVHLGDGVPMITRPKLLSLKPNGDMTMDMSIHYHGGFRAEVEAEAVVTVTKKIQPIKVSLVLVITLIRLEGRMQVWIKPPPCNRAWYGFYHTPQVEMKIEPVVSDKQIKSNLILKAIENKLMEAIAETMVLPNMDDVPFSDSEGVGGIFGEDILPGGETASTTQQPATPPHPPVSTSSSGIKWPHVPASRSATINVATDGAGHIRHGMDHTNEMRHRAETISSSSIYQNTRATKSHTSLGDELMQFNYSYETTTSQTTSPLDYDPMLSGGLSGNQTANRSGVLSESPEAIPTKKMGGQSSTTTTENSRTCGGKLLNLVNVKCANNSTNSSSNANTNGNLAGHSHHRRGSLDPAIGYSTGSSFGGNPHPGLESMRVMEEKWSHYGISEYDPQSTEGGKAHTKDKKKLREKEKHKVGQEADHVSIHSKDSGDTGSIYTNNTRWTESTGAGQSSIYGSSNGAGSSSHSTLLDTNSTSSRSEKFSLKNMFQGFRKKHTKGAHSGSSIQFNNNSTEILEGNEDEAQDVASTLIEDETEDGAEGRSQRQNTEPLEALPFHDYVSQTDGLTAATPIQATSTTLSDAYQPHFKQKFESTPNLTSISFSSDPKSGGTASLSTGSPQRGEDRESIPMARSGSPARSVYAASLFGADDSSVLSTPGSGVNNFSKSPPSVHSQSSQQQNLRLSPHLGSALRKLRNRSHGGSGSSKEELSIPPGDLNVVLKQLQQQQQNMDASAQNANGGNVGQDGKSVLVNGTQEDHESLPRDTNGSFLSPIQDQPDFESPIHSAPPSASAVSNRAIGGAPMIVLQKASPYLTQGDLHTHDDEVPPSRLSADGGRLRQYIPETQPIRQQPQEPTSVRIDRNLVHHPAQKPLEIDTGRSNLSTNTSGGRPRRHSINHTPTITPGGFSIHTHGYGLGVGGTTPTSPLRKEFSRDDDDSDSNENEQDQGLDNKDRSETTGAPYEDPAWTASRVRNSSDTLSTTSGHSSVSNSTKDSITPSQHSHSLKSILSSLGNKHKKKGHGTSAGSTTSGGGGYSVVNNQDPYSTVGLVGMVGVIAAGRMSANSMDTDPYAGVGLPQEARQHMNNSQEELSPRRGRGPEDSLMASALGPPAELDDPRFDTGFKPYEPEEMGVTETKKEQKQEDSPSREAMHARPGYIGEYPTPVRMHSFLNRQGAAIRAEAEAEEQELREDDCRRQLEGQFGQEQQQISSTVESTPSRPSSWKPASRSSSPLPTQLKEYSPIVKNTLVPTPPKVGMLPEAASRPLNGDEILMGMPIVETPSSESSAQSSMTCDRQSSTTASSVSSFSLRETMSFKADSLTMDNAAALHAEYSKDQYMEGATTGTTQTMTRYEYDMIMLSHSSPLQTKCENSPTTTTNPGSVAITADVGDAIAIASGMEEKKHQVDLDKERLPCRQAPDQSPAINHAEEYQVSAPEPQLQQQQQQQQVQHPMEQTPVEARPLEEPLYMSEKSGMSGLDEEKLDEGALAAMGTDGRYPSPEELRHQQAFMNQPSLAVPNSSSGPVSGAESTVAMNGSGSGSGSGSVSGSGNKKQHRNFFKRLIRRKSSEDIEGDASQVPFPEESPKRHRFLFHSGRTTGPTSPSSSLYLNPGSSQSMSAVGMGLSSVSNTSLPYSQGLRGETRSTTSSEFVRSRAQSTSASEEAAMVTGSGPLLSPMTKATRTRPRSSTVNAMPSVR